MRAMIVKEFRELVRDRRTLAMLLVMPILLLVIFGYAANFTVDRVPTTIVGPAAQELAEDLEIYETVEDDLEITDIRPDLGAADVGSILRDQESAAVIVASDDGDDADGSGAAITDRMDIHVDGSSLFEAQEAQGVFARLAAEDARDRVDDAQDQVEDARSQADEVEDELAAFEDDMQSFLDQMAAGPAPDGAMPEPPTPPEGLETPEMPEITTLELDPDDLVTVEFNPDLTTSWVMVPGMIGLILTFIGTLITSIGMVRERETGTLEQLAVMPLRPAAIILGKIVPYFLLALIDITLVTALGLWLFDVPFRGSVGLFAGAAIVFCFVVLGMGVLISTFSRTTGQAVQTALMFVVPQVLLSGLIFPLDAMPIGVRWIGYVLPLTWFREVAQGIMLRGAGADTLWLPLTILVGMAVVVFGVATLRMRATLTRGGGR